MRERTPLWTMPITWTAGKPLDSGHRVTLGEPEYGTPFVRQTDYTVTVDAADSAKVTGTWTDLGPTLPGTPGLSGTVNFTIGPPDNSCCL